jgi:hypothetical protein
LVRHPGIQHKLFDCLRILDRHLHERQHDCDRCGSHTFLSALTPACSPPESNLGRFSFKNGPPPLCFLLSAIIPCPICAQAR